MKTYIITGTTRGIGHALVGELAGDDATLFCLSRSGTNLEGIDAGSGQIIDVPVDLADIAALDDVLAGVLERVDLAAADGLYLVNNAGVIEPVAPIERQAADEVVTHLNVNLLAPMRLTARFIDLTAAAACRKVAVTVSSGASQNPYRGWAAYCAAKAGAHMFARVAGLEQADRAAAGHSPVLVYSVTPGKVDTNMQTTLRSHDPADFPDHAKFVQFKETGDLMAPEEAARRIAATLDDPAVQGGDYLDVR